jgi:hypothetical protein
VLRKAAASETDLNSDNLYSGTVRRSAVAVILKFNFRLGHVFEVVTNFNWRIPGCSEAGFRAEGSFEAVPRFV